MDPITMAIIGMQIAGSATQLYGQRKARKAEIKAYEQEAAFLEEQAKYTEEVGKKKEKILEQQASELYGDQVNSFSKNNATLSGSALAELLDTKAKFNYEIAALADDTAFDVVVARNRAEAQRQGAQGLRKAGMLQDVTTALVGASQVGGSLNRSISRTSTPSSSQGTLLAGKPSSYGQNTRGMTV